MKDRTAGINIFQGTQSEHDFSTGNTLPIVARPWGLHHWSLQTGTAPWTFDSRKKKLWGVRLTHQPSPWMRDYASMMLVPFHGEFYEDPFYQGSVYRLDQTEASPAYLKTKLLRYGITLEMAPTERGAVFVFSTEGTQPLKLRFQFDGPHELQWEAGSRRLTGLTADCFEGEELQNFGLHLEGEFDITPTAFYRTEKGGYLEFPEGEKSVCLRIAGSFISEELAGLSLEREVAVGSPSEIGQQGREIWNQLLGRLQIETRTKEQSALFYSCLYRCLLFPRFLDEVNAVGEVVHFSPYDGKVHEGSLCADSGFWDTYRTLYPLLTLVYPDVLQRMMKGWMSACRESGWSPKWASPGARDCMIGTHFNVLVADMVVKGLTDWDVEEAFSFLWKDATVPGTCGRFGRRGLREYIDRGFVAVDRGPYPVASTLDYAYDDFCVGRVAEYLGRTEEAKLLQQRSQNYRNIWDPATGFMRARSVEGSWQEPFREFAWGGAYIEGGPWQHRFNVPHDVEGLISLLGGREVFCGELDKMLQGPPTFEAGTYPFEIHEMTEMAAVDFGQYAHSNQPVHHFLFLYALAGKPERTDFWVGKVMDELYSIDCFPGDEDNGEMAAWYVWGSLGLFPVCPGRAEYLCFSAAVTKATLHVPGREAVELVGAKTEAHYGRLVGHEVVLNGF